MEVDHTGDVKSFKSLMCFITTLGVYNTEFYFYGLNFISTINK